MKSKKKSTKELEVHWEADNFLQLDYSKKKSVDNLTVKMLIENFFNEVSYKHIKEQKGISIIDFFNMQMFDKEEVFHFIANIVWEENIRDKGNYEISAEWYKLIAQYFNDAIDIYQRVFYRTVPKSFFQKDKEEEIMFNDFESLYKFVKWKTGKLNNKKPPYKQITCNLLKIISILYLIRSSWQLEKAKQDYDRINNYFFSASNEHFEYIGDNFQCEKYFKTLDNNTENKEAKNVSYNDFCIKKFKTSPKWYNWHKPIEFDLIWRPKTEESVLLKMLSQYEYNNMKSIMDLAWFKAEVKNWKDAVHLLEHVFHTLFGADTLNIVFKDKEVFDFKYYRENKHVFTEDFVEFMDSFIQKWPSRKETSWKWYKDMKLIWPAKMGDDLTQSIEFQIVLVDNKNESWYNAHPIKEWLNILESVIRMQWYVSLPYAKRVIKNLLHEYNYFPFSDCEDVCAEKILQEYLTNRWLCRIFIPAGKWKSTKEFVSDQQDFIRIAKAWMVPEETLIQIKEKDSTSGKYVFNTYTYDDLI